MRAGFGGVLFGVGVVALAVACGGDDGGTAEVAASGSGVAGTGGNAGAGNGGAGNAGAGNGVAGSGAAGGGAGVAACLPAAGTGATGPLGACYPPAAQCGIPGTRCMARVDVAGACTKTLRVAQMRLTKPALLASKAIQHTIFGPAVALEHAPNCALAADPSKAGTLNWLFAFDLGNPAGPMLKTGSSKPVASVAAGYCFAGGTYDGLDASPTLVKLSLDASTGAFQSVAPFALNLPMFMDQTATKSPLTLPLRGAVITGGQFREGGNCIGRFRGETGELDPKAECQPTTADPSDPAAYQYVPGMTLEGYLLAEDTDHVLVQDLKKSLCSLLANQVEKKPGPDGTTYDYCKRTPDGKLDFSGSSSPPDFASPGSGTKDAYGIGMELAASAVKINGDCP